MHVAKTPSNSPLGPSSCDHATIRKLAPFGWILIACDDKPVSDIAQADAKFGRTLAATSPYEHSNRDSVLSRAARFAAKCASVGAPDTRTVEDRCQLDRVHAQPPLHHGVMVSVRQ